MNVHTERVIMWGEGLVSILLLGVFLFCTLPVSAQEEEVAGQNILTLAFTVNGSKGPLFVPAKSRLDLRWSSPGAKECKGNWAVYKLKSTGTQSGKVTKPRAFTITCTDRNGNSKTSSVRVNLIAEKTSRTLPSPQSLGARKAETESPRASVSVPAEAAQPSSPQKTSEWPSLRLLSPNGDEVWRQGETRSIAWSADDVPLLQNGFSVDIFDTRGTVYSLPTSTVSSTVRSYSWLIPNTLPEGRYKARVKIQGQTFSDASDSFFSIAKTYAGFQRPLACGSLGDVNNDQAISAADMEQIAVLAANPKAATPDEFRRADVNVNGTLTSSDSVEVNLYLLETIKTFSGCGGPGVSVDLRVNGKDGSVTVPVNSNITLSWTSGNAGRCLLDGVFFPPSGSVSRSVGAPSRIQYSIECFATGNARSASDQVTVSFETSNREPLITFVDTPTSFQMARSSLWSVTSFDPDDTMLTLTVNWGDRSAQTIVIASTTAVGGSAVTPFTHVFTVAGTYIVTITVKDRRGAQASRSFTVVVTEQPRTSRGRGAYQFGALFEGYRALRPF